MTLPIVLVFVVRVCLKKSVEDGGAPWGRIVRVRVRLFVLRGLWKYLAEDVFSKTVIIVYRVVVIMVLTGVLLGIIICMSCLAALPATRTHS